MTQTMYQKLQTIGTIRNSSHKRESEHSDSEEILEKGDEGLQHFVEDPGLQLQK